MLLKVFLSLLCINYVHADRKNDTCGCYILGTLANVDGESLCNEQTLQCMCLPNVTGINCDQCVKGHYGIFSGRGCSKCSCSSFGSNSTQCNSITGTCTCKRGYAGSQCNQCALNKYKKENVCVNCHCNVNGSKDLQCDVNGQCSCHEHAEGKQCERCKENTYNIEEGCQPCPSCYMVVQDANTELKNDLHKSDFSLRQIEYNLSAIIQDFENFVTQLKGLYSKIETLLSFDNVIIPSHIEDLFLNIDKKVNSLQDDIVVAFSKANEFNTDEIMSSIAKVKVSLQDSEDLFKKGQEEFELARTRLEQIGTHNKTITEIAEAAMAVLKIVEKKAEEVSIDAGDIIISTLDVCAAAYLFEVKQREIQIDVETFNSDLNETRSGALTIKNYIDKFGSETKKTHADILALNERANEITVLDEQDILTETAIIKFDYVIVGGKMDDINTTSEEFNEIIDEIKEYLSKVENRQNIYENELVLLKKDEENANIAIEETTQLVTNAQKNYDDLIEYQTVHQKIQDLMKSVPDINEKIKAVLDNSKETKQIFVEVLDIIETNHNLNSKVDDILTYIETNETTILTNTEAVDQIVQEQETVSDRLIKLDEGLKNVRFNHDQLKSVETETLEKIQLIKAFSNVLNAIPLNEPDLEAVEIELDTLESMFNSIDSLRKEKNLLEEEMKNIKNVLENLPIEDKTLCEAPESEPKVLTTVTAK